MKKIFILFAFCCFSVSAQLPSPGCNPIYALDDDNDGYTQFDFNVFFEYIQELALVEHNYDLSGYTMALYKTETVLPADDSARLH
jgi:hypothetical protein